MDFRKWKVKFYWDIDILMTTTHPLIGFGAYAQPQHQWNLNLTICLWDKIGYHYAGEFRSKPGKLNWWVAHWHQNGPLNVLNSFERFQSSVANKIVKP